MAGVHTLILLCKPEIVDRPYREIARYAGVAHGTVGWLMAELPDLGYVAEYRRRRLLVEPERLLVNWAEAYARTLRPKCLMARYRAENIDWWEKLDAGEFGLELGGEVAAARMTKYLKPATMTLYAKEINNKFVAKFGLRKDLQGNVEILERFWNFNADHDGMVPLPLVYADLLATGDMRCIETAEKIYNKIIDGFEAKT